MAQILVSIFRWWNLRDAEVGDAEGALPDGGEELNAVGSARTLGDGEDLDDKDQKG